MKPFNVQDLLDCYERGVFPMADAREDDKIFLIDPALRGVLPLDGFHVPRRLARTVRSELYQVRIDTAFDQVVENCAAARPGRADTWINRPIQDLYRQLFILGYGHSVECWLGQRLVGGLYGVALGGAFFGESMFSLERDASKVALVHLAARLKLGQFTLLDTQFLTEHLSQFGAMEIPRAQYKRRLNAALERQGDFYLAPAYEPGEAVLQAISQAS
ncbi:MAG TPA: leucyl/phenylalanyl-tRNA--protein transferase [Caulobacteraceae bacterium]|nr:leucyl/phenylalanyl-tRNA--protein transferase [Caulobacteraceae bacterium]